MARALRVRMGWLFGRRVSVAERQMAAFAAGRKALGRAASANRPSTA